jgi:hypothetical protein
MVRVSLGKFSIVKPNGKFIKHRRCDSLGLARIVAGREQIRRALAPGSSRETPVDGLDLAGEVVKVRAPHRGSCERDSQLWDGVPGKPRCKQRADGGAVGV